MKVYLASPHMDDNFRARATKLLTRVRRIEVIDPIKARDFRGREIHHERQIVDGDLADVLACDVILGNYTVPGWGTAMETWFGFSLGRRVVAYVAPGGRVSPWVAHVAGGHDRVFRSLEDACSYTIAIS
jgi:nucleoside 2-deoxyribosyltransferase